jgi:hypothetical protein
MFFATVECGHTGRNYMRVEGLYIHMRIHIQSTCKFYHHQLFDTFPKVNSSSAAASSQVQKVQKVSPSCPGATCMSGAAGALERTLLDWLIGPVLGFAKARLMADGEKEARWCRMHSWAPVVVTKLTGILLPKNVFLNFFLKKLWRLKDCVVN